MATDKENGIIPEVFIDREGNRIERDPDSPEWRGYLSDIVQISTVMSHIFGDEGENIQNYILPIIVGTNMFMLKSQKERIEYITDFMKMLKDQNEFIDSQLFDEINNEQTRSEARDTSKDKNIQRPEPSGEGKKNKRRRRSRRRRKNRR